MSELKSIEKLREYAAYNCRVKGWKDDLKALADAIEAEVAESYMRVPCDADGVPIRVGDTVFNERWNEGRAVYEIGFTDNDGTRIYDEHGEWALAGACSHSKPRTLEDVLRDFAHKAVRIGMKGGVSPHVKLYADEDAIAECADEIRAMELHGRES